ncbi:MAG: tRNA (cytidine(56)-2'-O)-methyltransferase [Candidatus Diapherotrites archaeon]|nr:tRNA (cytidine(56)-2'-O)-methyltransferase [Candidatus Diapherotrites archaeon]
MKVHVLRFGHRKKRDIRVTSHCALVARALGAERIIIDGDKDDKAEKTLKGVNERFGQGIKVEQKAWKKTLKEYKNKGWKIAHLTMYGETLAKAMPAVRKEKRILVFVGAEKVPGEVYKIADWNIGIGNQPHSEIAALAIFLHELFEGKELERKFPKAKVEIIPCQKGKNVRQLQKSKGKS